MSTTDFNTIAYQNISHINGSSSAMLREYKAQVDKMADGLRDINDWVYFRPFHEMNGNWFWWGGRDPNAYKALWNNLYNYIYNTQGLKKVMFVFSPDKTTYGNYKAADYYPDNTAYSVTWIGIDAYSDDPANDPQIQQTYNSLVGKGKPIGFSEIGPAVGGSYIDKYNNQIRKFDYNLWNDAINNTYTQASFFVVWDKAYAPNNNYNGDILFSKSAQEQVKYNFENSLEGWNGQYVTKEWAALGQYSLKSDFNLSPNSSKTLSIAKNDNFSGKSKLQAVVKHASWGNQGSGMTAKLYVKTGSGYTWYDGGAIKINAGSNGTTLTLSLNPVANLGDIKEVGVEFRAGSGSSSQTAVYVDKVTLQ